ncbi:MAG: sugar ABC transporter ATP-binding protein [Candidatus Promineifilaceae bacterium]|nr:sugar ABC transporter ATP-binding protein [Candidatus Promineifilaceae bacterium]
MAKNGEQVLLMEGISKHFGGVKALENVDFDLNRGEVHALVGENGAGKSTLIKVLGGIIPRNAGRIIFDGREVNFHRPIDALEAGIAIIHQELSLMPELNVVENMFMGRMKSRLGILNWGELRRETIEAMNLINLHVDPNAIVRDLTISQRQMIEIARSLAVNAQLVVMDEPNSSLSESESEVLFDVIKRLKERGIAIIYVSHKIDEVLRISDRISVLRDGNYVGTITSADASEQDVINMMVGRELDRSAFSVFEHVGETILEVRHLTGRGFTDVSFDLNKGEILAFSGLVGAGRSEVNRAIFGADKFETGEIIFDGRPVHFKSPGQAIKNGLAMVPEDRKVLSLFMNMKIAKNMSMAELPHMTKGVINERRERSLVNEFVEKLDIRLASIDDPVSSLSGGNQQKTVLGRWLATDPKLLILDEPTHGVDIGAKSEIYELMRRLADDGMGIILISSELPEVLALAHRIVIMHEGRVTGIIDREGATEEGIMAYATGLADDFAAQSAPEVASA